jgi:release factor glutamine methyltransferase
MIETWTITKLLDWTTEYFKKYNIEWPHLEAEILLAHSLGLKRIELYTNHERVLTPAELGRFKQLIQRRSKHEPIAYITGVQPFMSIEFFVDRTVLIPRPETEKLVEAAIELLKQGTVVDIGTGSGAIAISLAKYLPDAKVIGTDSSPAAIEIAKKNAEHHNLADRIEFIVGDLFEPLKDKVDMIVSNPPYIPSKEIEKLETDVKDWEPREALDGGEDGLNYIRILIEKAPEHLKPNGHLLFENDYNQSQKVKQLVENCGKYKSIKIIKDLNGKERIIKAVLA